MVSYVKHMTAISLLAVLFFIYDVHSAQSEVLDNVVQRTLKNFPKSLVDVDSNVNYHNQSIVEAKTDAVEAKNSIEAVSEVIELILGHPRLNEARSAVCSARFEIARSKTNYYPKVNVGMSFGQKWIDKTTRSDEFGGSNSPEYDGDGVSLTMSVSQQLYDWGDTRAGIHIGKIRRSRALIERRVTLDTQITTFLKAALDYYGQEILFRQAQGIMADIGKTVESVQARFRSGAGRLLELRAAQLVRLEHQSQLDIIERRRHQALEVIEKQFKANKEQAMGLVEKFLEVRPESPVVIPAENSLQIQIVDLDILSIRYEIRQILARRFPKVEGVIVGRVWDIQDKESCGTRIDAFHSEYENGRAISGETGAFAPRFLNSKCNTHEVTGNIEVSMPLYDGGASKADTNERKARRIGLESARDAHIRDHVANSGYVQAQITDLHLQLKDKTTHFQELGRQLEGLLFLQGKTEFDPVAVIQMQGRYAAGLVELLSTKFQLENLRVEALQLSNSIARELGIELRSTGC